MLRRNPQRRKETSSGSKVPETFDPDPQAEAEHIRHTRVGVWDIYQDIRPQDKTNGLPSASFLPVRKLEEVLTSFPFVILAFKTLGAICFETLIIYTITALVQSLLPAATLHFSGQLLQVIQESIDSRSVDKTVLFSVLGCSMACTVLGRIARMKEALASRNIDKKMRSHYAEHILHVHVRLDVPTFDDPAIRSELKTPTNVGQNAAWGSIKTIMAIVTTIIRLVSQFSVLVRVLREQPDGTILALLSFADPIFMWISKPSRPYDGVWAATCRNVDYIRMQGLKILSENAEYRKELVAGNLQEHIVSEFRKARKRVGSNDVGESFTETLYRVYQKDRYSFLPFLSYPLQELPQIVFILRAVQSPRSIPVSLASLTLIRQTVSSFASPLQDLVYRASSISETFASIRRLYETVNVENKIIDGTEPYRKDKQTTGMALEFRDVSFKYPNTDKFAIRNVSFNIEQGQLCVLVGFNGSGKSTILKLLTRLYDPTEGIILVDGRDIKTLKLADLRRCISVLFQDYTHFPLSIKENIGMGNPEHATDDDMIRQAAELGGAREIIEELPEGFDTFLSKPVPDQFGRPEGTPSMFGRRVDYGRIRRKMGVSQKRELSGGQMQRIALSRTFMRSLGSDSDVGLLLFDEPSASLDPATEHDLFERLRQLRGNKTMVFSTHRFGQLTRHADKILYMANSTVLELGTHDELLKTEGGYSKMYNIQAAQFK